jgi:hypothetical protein
MSEAICIVCGKVVEPCNQAAHLRREHGTPIGGFKFWIDAVTHFSDKPSMLISDLRKQCNCPFGGFFMQDIDGEQVPYSDGQAVDLTHEPHFFILLPATI